MGALSSRACCGSRAGSLSQLDAASVRHLKALIPTQSVPPIVIRQIDITANSAIQVALPPLEEIALTTHAPDSRLGVLALEAPLAAIRLSLGADRRKSGRVSTSPVELEQVGVAKMPRLVRPATPLKETRPWSHLLAPEPPSNHGKAPPPPLQPETLPGPPNADRSGQRPEKESDSITRRRGNPLYELPSSRGSSTTTVAPTDADVTLPTSSNLTAR